VAPARPRLGASGPLRLSIDQARRIAVLAQLLSGPRPASLVEVTRHLGGLQMDPTSAVDRSERIVLWSRLGSYDRREIERELFRHGSLFEYWAYIVPMDDFAIHRETMRRFPRWEGVTGDYMRGWMKANAGFRRHVLERLRTDGPLRTRDIEDRASVPWRNGGWNAGKNVSRMLEMLWDGGKVATVGRDGVQRLWDLAERRYPLHQPRMSASAVALALARRQLAWRGIARRRDLGRAFDGPVAGREAAVRRLEREGAAHAAVVDGLPGTWLVDAGLLDAPFQPRTVLLSPFDKLVSHRDRAEMLFGFRFRLEIYVPVAKREYGYFVLPILHGDRLVGRIDPMYDRRTRVLRLNAVHAEPEATAAAGPDIAAAIRELAGWLGAEAVETAGDVPRIWRPALRSIL
jgi:uncharacterized protein YcaQ